MNKNPPKFHELEILLRYNADPNFQISYQRSGFSNLCHLAKQNIEYYIDHLFLFLANKANLETPNSMFDMNDKSTLKDLLKSLQNEKLNQILQLFSDESYPSYEFQNHLLYPLQIRSSIFCFLLFYYRNIKKNFKHLCLPKPILKMIFHHISNLQFPLYKKN